MAKQTILLTGSSGFIGRNIYELLSEKYIFYRPSHSELDLTDTHAVDTFFKSHEIDIVIHCASIGGKRNSIYITDSVEKNLRMYFNLVHNTSHFIKMIHLGSGAEYDKSRPISSVSEDDFGKRIPGDQYGFYKYICSRQALLEEKIIVLRVFGIFGRYEDYTSRFISNNICRVLYDMSIQVNQNAFFDFIYVDDFVSLIDYFITHDQKKRILNIGVSKKIDLLTIAKKIKKITKSNRQIIIKKNGLQNEYTCDNSRLIREVGKFRFTSLDKAIAELYEWYHARKDEISPEYFVD